MFENGNYRRRKRRPRHGQGAVGSQKEAQEPEVSPPRDSEKTCPSYDPSSAIQGTPGVDDPPMSTKSFGSEHSFNQEHMLDGLKAASNGLTGVKVPDRMQLLKDSHQRTSLGRELQARLEGAMYVHGDAHVPYKTEILDVKYVPPKFAGNCSVGRSNLLASWSFLQHLPHLLPQENQEHMEALVPRRLDTRIDEPRNHCSPAEMRGIPELLLLRDNLGSRSGGVLAGHNVKKLDIHSHASTLRGRSFLIENLIS